MLEKQEDTTLIELEEKDVLISSEIEAMVQAGLFYGRIKGKTHPKMKPFIALNRNGVEIINLSKTTSLLKEAGEFIAKLMKDGKKILFVATQPSAADDIKELALELNCPYVTQKWVGGALTNFMVIRKRIAYYSKLKKDFEEGKLTQYTKKEQSQMKKELQKMDFIFGGIEDMNVLPDALFVVNANLHSTAVNEAKITNIPVLAVISTDSDPRNVKYPIIANDNSKTSIQFIIKTIRDTISVSLK
ncbi:MAG: 30S ribosomal protein S2 [Candidatus Liptonbacteria bacterium CG11_big_fil_rev_8_21_14_0_20_35_14]|uniref:Small ribosomal subunit protein uS2 n=1 Tax=Candidatus Liptonbacteria bacterium CG11_big_fil_rev_8_21_14_0_20_35_14 TaxID=1974634 RepID=A0A2H0N9F3_9BACT|nr:MAG: 30S ribosomal protein S2 [Candidatus Liptonbacteria bacterium CG11_big_fil_rev_8_21_14_0_20_35_14]